MALFNTFSRLYQKTSQNSRRFQCPFFRLKQNFFGGLVVEWRSLGSAWQLVASVKWGWRTLGGVTNWPVKFVHTFSLHERSTWSSFQFLVRHSEYLIKLSVTNVQVFVSTGLRSIWGSISIVSIRLRSMSLFFLCGNFLDFWKKIFKIQTWTRSNWNLENV
jgi:hypothetical protein